MNVAKCLHNTNKQLVGGKWVASLNPILGVFSYQIDSIRRRTKMVGRHLTMQLQSAFRIYFVNWARTSCPTKCHHVLERPFNNVNDRYQCQFNINHHIFENEQINVLCHEQSCGLLSTINYLTLKSKWNKIPNAILSRNTRNCARRRFSESSNGNASIVPTTLIPDGLFRARATRRIADLNNTIAFETNKSKRTTPCDARATWHELCIAVKTVLHVGRMPNILHVIYLFRGFTIQSTQRTVEIRSDANVRAYNTHASYDGNLVREALAWSWNVLIFVSCVFRGHHITTTNDLCIVSDDVARYAYII